MASNSSRARLNPRHQEMVKAKIQASQIINRLQNHIDGKIELSPTQVSAAKILLDRSVPTLSSVEMSGPEGGPLQAVINDPTRRANRTPE